MATPPAVPPTAAAATSRRALTIGINAYDRVPLKNARNDAEAVHAKLRENGWDARNELDPDTGTMFSAIREFVRSIQPGDSVFFFFAGHDSDR